MFLRSWCLCATFSAWPYQPRRTPKSTWVEVTQSSRRVGVMPGCFFLFKIQADILIEHLFIELRYPCLTHTLLKAALRKWGGRRGEKRTSTGVKKKKKVHEMQFMMFQAAVGGFLWRDQADTQRLGGHTAEMFFKQTFFPPPNSTFPF